MMGLCLSLRSHFADVSYVKCDSGETKEEIISYLKNILILANEVLYLACSISLLSNAPTFSFSLLIMSVSTNATFCTQ